MWTGDGRVTRRVLGWAIGMTVALYAIIWLIAGPPAIGAAAPAAVSHAAVTRTTGGF